jgi:hypothetical protein
MFGYSGDEANRARQTIGSALGIGYVEPMHSTRTSRWFTVRLYHQEAS